MLKPIAVVGAPSSIGLRPYDDGEARHLDRAPAVLRERGLIERIDAADFGDVMPPPYRDYVRPANRPRNESEVQVYSRYLADRVAAVISSGRFALVLGGDCSVALGCLLGARRARRRVLGLAYIDAHADFAAPDESASGAVSGMTLRFVSGRSESRLARLAGPAPLVAGEHIALVGRRDTSGSGSSSRRSALVESSILDLPISTLRSLKTSGVASRTLSVVAAPGVDGFWIQLDADVLSPDVMAAVDTPEPGGLMPNHLIDLLTPLVQHPRAVGMSLTVYDPALDPDRAGARQLVRLLESIFAAKQMSSAADG